MWERRPWPPLLGLAEATRTGRRSDKGLGDIASPLSSGKRRLTNPNAAI
jgi:hypothetical protein